MKKKIVALLLAVLISVLPAAAMAEAGGLYTVAIMDPQVWVGEDLLLDMTGLDVEMSLALTDVGPMALLLNVFAGENYENLALAAQAQVDHNGVVGYLDGMTHMYSVDLASLIGADPYAILASLPLNTLANSIEIPTATDADMLAMRQSIIAGLISGFSSDGVNFTVTKEQGAQVLLTIAQLVDTYSAQIAASTGEDPMGGESAVEIITNDGIAFELSGSMNVTDAGYTLTATGNVYGNEVTVPLNVNVTDSLDATDALIQLVNPEDAADTVDIAFVREAALVDETRKSVCTTLSMTVEGESLVIDYDVTPVADSAEVDTYITITVPGANEVIQLAYLTGLNPEQEVGTYVGFGIYDAGTGDAVTSFYGYYEGSTTGAAKDHSGYLELGVYDAATATDYTVNAYLYLVAQEADTSAWLLDSSASIDAMSMDEAAVNTAMMGLMGAVANGATVIQENVPGLAAAISSLMSSMM